MGVTALSRRRTSAQSESAVKSVFSLCLSCLSRSDFVTLPFQGAEVLLDSVMPLSGNRWGLWLGGAQAGVESRSFSLRPSFSPTGLKQTQIAATLPME